VTYLLDTNTLIYVFKNEGKVGQRLLQQSRLDIVIPILAVYELEVGIAKSQAPALRRQQLAQLLEWVRVAPLGMEEVRQAARIRATLEQRGEPIGPIDVLIAGTALAQTAVLVTRNIREFGRVPGLQVEDWY
jgi:tRNA(fMet)-specific endonuclease VapC